VDNVNIPAHQAHLQMQDSRVAALIGQNELDGVTISHPHEALSKDVLTTLVDGIITRESLTKM
jgi:hypothetical protein